MDGIGLKYNRKKMAGYSNHSLTLVFFFFFFCFSFLSSFTHNCEFVSYMYFDLASQTERRHLCQFCKEPLLN